MHENLLMLANCLVMQSMNKAAVEDKSFPSSDESFFMEDRNIELIQKMINNETPSDVIENSSTVNQTQDH